jgi:hypothetical protein
MSKPRYTDARRRYRTAEESRAPGYLARRLKAYARLQRMKAATQTVTPLRKVAK